MQEFTYNNALKLNLARIKHLNELNLDFNNKKILETGCGGVGNITDYLIKQKAFVTLNDSRIENINSLIKTLNVELPFNTWNLNEDLPATDMFDIIICYGTLYHLTSPGVAIKNLSKICKEYIIISTCTNGKNTSDVNILYEGNSPTQGHEGYGCRPGRKYIFNELQKNFKYVYMLKTQPDNDDFPLSFPSNHHASRCIFVGSHNEIKNGLFVDFIPDSYTTS